MNPFSNGLWSAKVDVVGGTLVAATARTGCRCYDQGFIVFGRARHRRRSDGSATIIQRSHRRRFRHHRSRPPARSEHVVPGLSTVDAFPPACGFMASRPHRAVGQGLDFCVRLRHPAGGIHPSACGLGIDDTVVTVTRQDRFRRPSSGRKSSTPREAFSDEIVPETPSRSSARTSSSRQRTERPPTCTARLLRPAHPSASWGAGGRSDHRRRFR